MNIASKEIQKRLDELDAQDDDCGLPEEEKEESKSLFAELTNSKLKQEAILFQKARQRWINQGDHNTFFSFVGKLEKGKESAAWGLC